MSPFILLDDPSLLGHQLLKLSDDSLVSSALSSLLFDFLLQEANGLLILLLLFSIYCHLTVHFIGQFHFLIQHFLHLLDLSLIGKTFSSFVFDGVSQIVDIVIVFHSDSIILKQLLLLFL